MICHQGSQKFPFQPCPAAADSISPHGLCRDVAIPELPAATGSLAGSMGFVSHQLLLILDISISSHPLTICHGRSITSLSNASHPKISLNQLYPKGKEKVDVWVIRMLLLPGKSNSCKAL